MMGIYWQRYIDLLLLKLYTIGVVIEVSAYSVGN